MEALVCHPLDTIKVRMQLRGKNSTTPANLGFLGIGNRIVQREGVLALYKGLGAVISGIVPKMAIRFVSFEFYKGLLEDSEGKVTFGKIFLAGLGAGVTEAVLVVTPMDVLKIRLQAQRHSLADPLDVPKYRNAGHAAYRIVMEEGISALYKGVTLTALRQSTNQAVNFTVYRKMKDALLNYQNLDVLPSWQHLIAGGLSGAMGPMANAPIDTIKTRIQRGAAAAQSGISGGSAAAVAAQKSLESGESGWKRFSRVATTIYKEEGWRAFYKGLTPRLLRVAPGQAITFMVYERIQRWINSFQLSNWPNMDSTSTEV